jgi:hypothetical protein
MFKIVWPWIDRGIVECSTMKQARSIITGSLNQDCKEHKIGNEVVFEYYFTILAIVKDMGDQGIPDTTCPTCGK